MIQARDLPREHRGLFSSMKNYAESALEYREEAERIRDRHNRAVAAEKITTLRTHVENLGFLLFAHILNSKISYGTDLMEKSVELFESLNVPRFRIGSTEYFRDAPIIISGRELVRELMTSIKDEELKAMFSRNEPTWKIAKWYKDKIANA